MIDEKILKKLRQKEAETPFSFGFLLSVYEMTARDTGYFIHYPFRYGKRLLCGLIEEMETWDTPQ